MSASRPVSTGVLTVRERRSARVVLLAVCAVAAVVAIAAAASSIGSAFAAPPSSGAGVATALAAARSALPADGAVFHKQERVFRRHGPAAAEINSWGGLGALPESYIHEVWVRVDGSARLLQAISEIRDLQGTVLQRTYVGSSEVTVQDLRSGLVTHQPRPDRSGPLSAPSDIATAGWAHYEAAFQSGDMGFSRIGQADGTTLAVFSERRPAPAAQMRVVASSDGTTTTEPAVAVPYHADLALVGEEERVAFDDATHEPRYEQILGLTQSGQMVEIASTHWLAWETLPAASWGGIADSAGVNGAR